MARPRVGSESKELPNKMNSPIRFLLLGALGFGFASTQRNNTNVEQKIYSPPVRGADFIQCKKEIEAGSVLFSNPSFRPVFVDCHGAPTDDPARVCGVDYTTCVGYCGARSAPSTWSSFSPQFTAWLLPFVAFTAQFPYQAATTWDNLMSAILTVGAPALAIFSLILSFLGPRWLQKKCAVAIDRMPASTQEERVRQLQMRNIFGDMGDVLCLAQQEPYENLEFQPLPKDIDAGLQSEVEWWGRLNAMVKRSKRGYTASFVHQILWVNIAFAFAVVDAFKNEQVSHLFLEVGAQNFPDQA